MICGLNRRTVTSHREPELTSPSLSYELMRARTHREHACMRVLLTCNQVCTVNMHARVIRVRLHTRSVSLLISEQYINDVLSHRTTFLCQHWSCFCQKKGLKLNSCIFYTRPNYLATANLCLPKVKQKLFFVIKMLNMI